VVPPSSPRETALLSASPLRRLALLGRKLSSSTSLPSSVYIVFATHLNQFFVPVRPLLAFRDLLICSLQVVGN